MKEVWPPLLTCTVVTQKTNLHVFHCSGEVWALLKKFGGVYVAMVSFSLKLFRTCTSTRYKWSWINWYCLACVKPWGIISSFSRALWTMINTRDGKLKRECYKWTEAYSFSPSYITELLCQLSVQTGSTNLPAGLPRALPAHWKYIQPGQRKLMQESWGWESRSPDLPLTDTLLLTYGAVRAGAQGLKPLNLCQPNLLPDQP